MKRNGYLFDAFNDFILFNDILCVIIIIVHVQIRKTNQLTKGYNINYFKNWTSRKQYVGEMKTIYV